MLSKEEYSKYAYKAQRLFLQLITSDKFRNIRRGVLMNEEIDTDPTTIATIDEEQVDQPAAYETIDQETTDLEQQMRLMLQLPSSYQLFIRNGAVAIINMEKDEEENYEGEKEEKEEKNKSEESDEESKDKEEDSEEDKEEDKENKDEEKSESSEESSEDKPEMKHKYNTYAAIPGMHNFMELDDNLEEVDTIQNVPTPTKEEGHSPDPEIVDLDDISPKEPDSTDIVIEINDNRSEERTVEMRELKNKILFMLNDFDNKIRMYNQGYIGQEGIANPIKNFLTGTVNILGHIGNLFKTGLLYGWRDFKRGELADYVESNRLTMTRIYNADFFRIEEKVVPVPQGMKGPYEVALKSLTDYMKAIDMPKRAKQMEQTVESIYKDMHKANPTFTSQVKDIRRTYTTPELEKLFNDTGKIFTPDKKRIEDKFGKVFDSMKQYEAVIKSSIDTDDYLRQVAGIHGRLESIQNTVTKIIDDSGTITKSQAEDLSKVIRGMAECFGNYGAVCTDLVRIQHNLTFVTKIIRAHLEM